MSALPPTSDDTKIWDIWESIFTLPVVTVSIELGVFKALSDETLTTEELAAQLGLDARALAMLLAALCSQGLIDKRLGRWSATHETRRPPRSWSGVPRRAGRQDRPPADCRS